jgi:hypothetical protein
LSFASECDRIGETVQRPWRSPRSRRLVSSCD